MREAAIYLRKSRADILAEQRGEGETLARHESILREFAAKNGIKIVHTYREVVSGDTIAARPQVQALLTAVTQGQYTNVLVVDLDRLSRGDLEDQGRIVRVLRNAQCFLMTPSRTYDPNNDDDMAYIEFGLFFARLEYRRIKGRLQAGLDESVREGQWISATPYGYRAHYLTGHGRVRTLVPDPETAPVVRMIYEMAADGYSNGEIVTELLDRGIPTMRGGDWSLTHIAKILKNPVYAGKVYRGLRKTSTVVVDGTEKKIQRKNAAPAILVNGLHEPLIDEEILEAVRVRNESRHPPVKKSLALKNPYAGVLVCSKCGRPMLLVNMKGYNYFRHPRVPHKSKESSCGMPMCSASGLSRLIVLKLKEELEDFEVCVIDDRQASRVRRHEERMASLHREVAAAERALDVLYDLIERDKIDEDRFTRRRNDLLAKQKNLARRIEEEAAVCPEAFIEEQITTLHNALDLLEDKDVSPREKNDFLKAFIERIEYTRVVDAPGRGLDDSQVKLQIFFKSKGVEQK